MGSEFRATIDIDRPIEGVWDHLMASDVWRQPIVTSVERIDDGPVGEGAQFAIQVSIAGRQMRRVNEIVAHDPTHHLEWTQLTTDALMVTVSGNDHLEPLAETGTRFTLHNIVETHGVPELLDPVLAMINLRIIGPRLLANSRDEIES